MPPLLRARLGDFSSFFISLFSQQKCLLRLPSSVVSSLKRNEKERKICFHFNDVVRWAENSSPLVAPPLERGAEKGKTQKYYWAVNAGLPGMRHRSKSNFNEQRGFVPLGWRFLTSQISITWGIVESQGEVLMALRDCSLVMLTRISVCRVLEVQHRALLF